jgi:SAM-dependent methyltransferase
VELQTGRSDVGSSVEFGVVRTEAGAFPIVAGVLRLLDDGLCGPIVRLVEAGRDQEALRAALEVPFLNKREAQVNALWRRASRTGKLGLGAHARGPRKQHLYRIVTQSNVSFAELAAGAGATEWTNWQTHRFSMPTFQPVYALAHTAKSARTILDFGCGLGHSSFLLRRLSAADAVVVCADYSFTSMYLARRFLVPDALCICLDGDFPLPFVDGYFDAVFSTDALQYIESKVGLAREFRRVLSAEGIIALAHLHSRLSSYRAGHALTAQGYYGLFEGMVRRIYPEDSLVADYVADGVLNLDRVWPLDDLKDADYGLSLVAANTDAAFSVRPSVLDDYIDAMRHPEPNPAYRTTRINGAWTFDRKLGEPYVGHRTIRTVDVLPSTWKLEQESVDSAGILALRQADRPLLRELVRRFVVLETPESYV